MALPEALRVFDVDAPLPRLPHPGRVCRALIVYQLCCRAPPVMVNSTFVVRFDKDIWLSTFVF